MTFFRTTNSYNPITYVFKKIRQLYLRVFCSDSTQIFAREKTLDNYKATFDVLKDMAAGNLKLRLFMLYELQLKVKYVLRPSPGKDLYKTAFRKIEQKRDSLVEAIKKEISRIEEQNPVLKSPFWEDTLLSKEEYNLKMFFLESLNQLKLLEKMLLKNTELPFQVHMQEVFCDIENSYNKKKTEEEACLILGRDIKIIETLDAELNSMLKLLRGKLFDPQTPEIPLENQSNFSIPLLNALSGTLEEASTTPVDLKETPTSSTLSTSVTSATPTPASPAVTPQAPVSEETNNAIRKMFMSKSTPNKQYYSFSDDESSDSDSGTEQVIVTQPKPAWMTPGYKPATLSGEEYVKNSKKSVEYTTQGVSEKETPTSTPSTAPLSPQFKKEQQAVFNAFDNQNNFDDDSDDEPDYASAQKQYQQMLKENTNYLSTNKPISEDEKRSSKNSDSTTVSLTPTLLTSNSEVSEFSKESPFHSANELDDLSAMFSESDKIDDEIFDNFIKQQYDDEVISPIKTQTPPAFTFPTTALLKTAIITEKALEIETTPTKASAVADFASDLTQI